MYQELKLLFSLNLRLFSKELLWSQIQLCAPVLEMDRFYPLHL